MDSLQCPLCASSSTADFCQIPSKSGDRRYLLCSHCDLMFLDPAQRPDQSAERLQYELHNNVITEEHYCAFLNRLIDPLLAKIGTPATPQMLNGLDFGSGPGPVLAELLARAGHNMSIYDPFFAPDTKVLHHQYDFVTCTEVAEHFYGAGTAFQQIDTLIKPGGWFALMTGMLADWSGFEKWHYHRDITHVVFYSPKTIDWIAEKFRWKPELAGSNVVLFQKSI